MVGGSRGFDFGVFRSNRAGVVQEDDESYRGVERETRGEVVVLHVQSGSSGERTRSTESVDSNHAKLIRAN